MHTRRQSGLGWGGRATLLLAVTCLALACTQDFDEFFQGASGGGGTGTGTGTGTTGTGGTSTGTSTGASGGGGTGGSLGGGGTGGGGTGGVGGGAECSAPDQCPGQDTTCQWRTCLAQICGTENAALGTACSEGGGAFCDDQGSCVECNGSGDCQGTDTCQNNVCVPELCSNLTQDGDETDVDCGGGSCAPCANTLGCIVFSDCVSRFCNAGTCAACGGDGDCVDPPSAWCNGGSCDDQKPVGDACSGANECLSGFCPGQDGVCCDAVCDGVCEACLAAKTGGSDGTCDFVLDDTDPDGECLTPGEACDGGGACMLRCSAVPCTDDTECTPAATGGVCSDVADDCSLSACVGAQPGVTIEAGAPQAEDFNSWQSNEQETTRGGQRWYCNATLPVSADGVLLGWQMFVDNNGNSGEVAQLAVIRCTAGGGGNGPALSDCVRVGLGPIQSVTGNGLQTFTLAGSTQLDGAPVDPNGIVVQAGDYICADSDRYDIGVDCDGTPNGGNCPGPDFDTQQVADLDTVGEPFVLGNSISNGVLMIKSVGISPPVPGTCSDVEPEPDTVLCSVNGGDTCCAGVCIVGPNGAGTCS